MKLWSELYGISYYILSSISTFSTVHIIFSRENGEMPMHIFVKRRRCLDPIQCGAGAARRRGTVSHGPAAVRSLPRPLAFSASGLRRLRASTVNTRLLLTLRYVTRRYRSPETFLFALFPTYSISCCFVCRLLMVSFFTSCIDFVLFD